MGKFYVYIQLEKKKFKVCKDDIREVYSLRKIRHPLLPSYNSDVEKEDQQNVLDTSSSEV